MQVDQSKVTSCGLPHQNQLSDLPAKARRGRNQIRSERRAPLFSWLYLGERVRPCPRPIEYLEGVGQAEILSDHEIRSLHLQPLTRPVPCGALEIQTWETKPRIGHTATYPRGVQSQRQSNTMVEDESTRLGQTSLITVLRVCDEKRLFFLQRHNQQWWSDERCCSNQDSSRTPANIQSRLLAGHILCR